jgi:hypothetical protein
LLHQEKAQMIARGRELHEPVLTYRRLPDRAWLDRGALALVERVSLPAENLDVLR